MPAFFNFVIIFLLSVRNFFEVDHFAQQIGDIGSIDIQVAKEVIQILMPPGNFRLELKKLQLFLDCNRIA